MKKVKRVFTIALIPVMVWLFTACSSSKDNSVTASGTESQSSASASSSTESQSSPKNAVVYADNGSKTVYDADGSIVSSSNESSASDSSYEVDVDALKKIEEEDNCKVKVTKKEILTDAYAGNAYNLNLGGADDAFVLHVTNNDDAAVSDINILIVAYDGNNNAQTISTGWATVNNGDKYVKVLSTKEETAIDSGKTEELPIKVKEGTIEGFRCIVESYKKNGTEITNDLAEEWYKSVYKGKTKTLD